MTVFYHEQPQHSAKGCKFLSSLLKDAFSICHFCKRPFSTSNYEEEEIPVSDFDDQEEIVSTIITRAMEAKARRRSFMFSESFSSVFYPSFGDSFATTAGGEREMRPEDNNKEIEREDYLSVASRFSHCSSCASAASEFLSVKTSFSLHPTMKGLEFFPEIQRRSIIQELCHCEGWPFGLCRRAILLPPLPKSPSESWSWCKGTKVSKFTE